MKPIKVGDVVNDGCGNRGVVIRVETAANPDPFTRHHVQQIYVDWQLPIGEPIE